MAIFKLYKNTGKRALYRTDGSTQSVRFNNRAFEGGAPPETIEMNVTFAQTATGGGSVPVPAEIAEAAAKVAAFRAQLKAQREAAMTPAQRAKRAEKQKAREAEKAAKAAAKAKTKAPATAPATAAKQPAKR